MNALPLAVFGERVAGTVTWKNSQMEPATLYMMVAAQGQERLLHPRGFPSVAACEDYVTEWRRTATGRTISRYECKIIWPMEESGPPFWTRPQG